MIEFINDTDNDEIKMQKINAIIKALIFDNPQQYINKIAEKTLAASQLDASKFDDRLTNIEEDIKQLYSQIEKLNNLINKNKYDDTELRDLIKSNQYDDTELKQLIYDSKYNDKPIRKLIDENKYDDQPIKELINESKYNDKEIKQSIELNKYNDEPLVDKVLNLENKINETFKNLKEVL